MKAVLSLLLDWFYKLNHTTFWGSEKTNWFVEIAILIRFMQINKHRKVDYAMHNLNRKIGEKKEKASHYFSNSLFLLVLLSLSLSLPLSVSFSLSFSFLLVFHSRPYFMSVFFLAGFLQDSVLQTLLITEKKATPKSLLALYSPYN